VTPIFFDVLLLSGGFGLRFVVLVRPSVGFELQKLLHSPLPLASTAPLMIPHIS